MAQLLSNFGADLTGLRQGASCAAREKAPSFLHPIRVCRHALASEPLRARPFRLSNLTSSGGRQILIAAAAQSQRGAPITTPLPASPSECRPVGDRDGSTTVSRSRGPGKSSNTTEDRHHTSG